MRIPLLLLVWAVSTTFAPRGVHQPIPIPARTMLSFEPLPLYDGEPDRRRLGKLTYLQGWSIGSNDPRFGGLSAIHVEGAEVLGVSDGGIIARFRLPGASQSGPAAIFPIAQGPGSGERKQDRDAESLVVQGGKAWIGFEKYNNVWRYDRATWRATAHAKPRAMRKWRANAGSEAMVRLADGRFLVFSEGSDEKPESDVVLFGGDPALGATKARRLRYRRPDGYRITDAALLPDGGLLLLHRRVSLLDWVSAKLLVVPPAAVRGMAEGGLIEGEEIAELRRPAAIDNMEALSVTRERGRTIVWIASDDNFNPLQRTLLLKFALEG